MIRVLKPDFFMLAGIKNDLGKKAVKTGGYCDLQRLDESVPEEIHR